MRPNDRELARRLEDGLISFDQTRIPLPGINDSEMRKALIEQLLESIHRIRYVSIIASRPISESRAHPRSELFDPLKAAIVNQRKGNIDEAFWLVFIFIHFGKHARGGWRYARDIYGRLNQGDLWGWEHVSNNPGGFRNWLSINKQIIQEHNIPGGFGNHRKYQSLDAYARSGTGSAVETYVNWVHPPRTHQQLMDQALQRANGDPKLAFDILYESMSSVASFGRTARFDYLTMVGKLGLATIEPGSAYLATSTGPLVGARLLFGSTAISRPTAADLDAWIVELGLHLNVGMQVLEDAICNWQKSPDRFKPFRG